MAKTTVDVDPQRLAAAQTILGTSTLRDTIDAALRQVITADARRQFLDLAKDGVFAELADPEFRGQAWR
jgi:Arc/MetJ family transcription regulator